MSLDQDLNQHLLQILKETHNLTFSTQMAHWLTDGKTFYSWHEMYQGHYKQLAEMTDEIAEIILMFNGKLDNELQFYTFSSGQFPKDSFDQIDFLDNKHQICVECLKLGADMAETLRNQVIADLLVHHQAKHQKITWFYKKLVA